MASFKHIGNFNKIETFLKRMTQRNSFLHKLNEYGRAGVDALSSATPVDSGKTANSWDYEIYEENGSVIISWNNSNVNNGVPIAVILQYGHGTKNGGYVRGVDYINPALRPIFESIANSAWEEVTK